MLTFHSYPKSSDKVPPPPHEKTGPFNHHLASLGVWMSTLQTTHIDRHWPKKQLLIQDDLQESQVYMSDDHVKHLLIFPSHPEEVKAEAKPNRERGGGRFSFPISAKLPGAACTVEETALIEFSSILLPQITGALSTVLDSPKCLNWYFWSSEKATLVCSKYYPWKVFKFFVNLFYFSFSFFGLGKYKGNLMM